MNYACAANYSCYGPLTSLSVNDELSHTIIALYVSAVVILLLSIYLDNVVPHDYGVSKHPLFFLQPLIQRFKAKKETGERTSLIDLQNIEDFDSDVAEEHR